MPTARPRGATTLASRLVDDRARPAAGDPGGLVRPPSAVHRGPRGAPRAAGGRPARDARRGGDGAGGAADTGWRGGGGVVARGAARRLAGRRAARPLPAVARGARRRAAPRP